MNWGKIPVPPVHGTLAGINSLHVSFLQPTRGYDRHKYDVGDLREKTHFLHLLAIGHKYLVLRTFFVNLVHYLIHIEEWCSLHCGMWSQYAAACNIAGCRNFIITVSCSNKGTDILYNTGNFISQARDGFNAGGTVSDICIPRVTHLDKDQFVCLDPYLI